MSTVSAATSSSSAGASASMSSTPPFSSTKKAFATTLDSFFALHLPMLETFDPTLAERFKKEIDALKAARTLYAFSNLFPRTLPVTTVSSSSSAAGQTPAQSSNDHKAT